MFADLSQSYELSMNVLQGKPSGRLLWYSIPRHAKEPAAQAGYADPADFLTRELGALHFESLVDAFPARMPEDVQILETPQDEAVLRELRCPWGALREVRKNGQIVQHRVTGPEDLRTLIEIWKRMEFRPRPELFRQKVADVRGRGPVGVVTGTSSLQMLVQHDLGVANFWYAVADYPELVEEAMETYQAAMQPAYDALDQFDADYFYQGENTSTTMISPDFYRKYSAAHIRQFTRAAKRCGKPSMVHMCGLLRDLMPIFPETGMDGIDCLTPPPVGDCEFAHAFRTMPKGFFCSGRFNSNSWVGKTRRQILDCLQAQVPREVYRDHAFVMIVTTDLVPNIPADNWRLLRDCINEYDRG